MEMGTRTISGLVNQLEKKTPLTGRIRLEKRDRRLYRLHKKGPYILEKKKEARESTSG